MTADIAIPIIDVSPYLDSDATAQAKANVIKLFQTACSDFGFVQVKGHGIPLEVQQRVLQACKTFFNLPVHEKESLQLKDNPARHGYERLGEQTLNKKALPDDKEGIYIGKDVSTYTGFRQGPNQWPNSLDPEAFRKPVMEYYHYVLKLACNLVEILVLGLGHSRDVLDSFLRDPVQTMKLLHYPPHTSKDVRQFGAGQHTDFGAITILLQQPGKDGLQVHYAPEDAWIDVPAVDDILVINIGDLVQKWTYGAYKSTVHRVINAAGDDRYSVPCFFEGNMTATNPFDPNDASGETVEQHIKKKLDASYT